jgi:hypothetical protein
MLHVLSAGVAHITRPHVVLRLVVAVGGVDGVLEVRWTE